MREKISKETQDKLAQLQLLQQRLQVFSAQKQQIQLQLIEVENALAEITKTKKPVYKLIGGLLIEKKSAELKKELTETKKRLELQISSLDKQEQTNKKKAMDLQSEITKVLG